MKEELINSIRTWMNQVVADKGSYRTNELARAYFILFSAAFSLEKHKEAAKILEDFSSFAGSIPQGAAHGTSEINSVGFWLSQAQRIGEKLASVKS